MSKQLELFPVTKPAAKVEEKTPNNINEYFLNKTKTNPLDKLPAAVVENYNKYDAEDGKNIVVGPGGQIMMESELRKQLKISNGNMSTWDAVKEVSKKDPAEMKQIKKILFKEYNRSGTKNLSDGDLKIIKRGKYSELLKPIIKPVAPIAPIVPREPEIPLEIKIKQLADAKLKAQQAQWDKEHGAFGLSNLMRPK